MNAIAARHTPGARQLLNKVPEITLWFWVIKIMCTTVGETAADYLNVNLGFGLSNTTYVTGALLAVLLLVQMRLRRYVPAVYWAVVVVISCVAGLVRSIHCGFISRPGADRVRLSPGRRPSGSA